MSEFVRILSIIKSTASSPLWPIISLCHIIIFTNFKLYRV